MENKNIIEDDDLISSESEEIQIKKKPISKKTDYELYEQFRKRETVKNYEKRINMKRLEKGIYDLTEDEKKNKYIKKYIDDLNEKAKEIKLKSKRGKYTDKGKQYLFITINPRECDIKDLDKIIDKLRKKLYIYNYVYEQRGEKVEEMGKGKHIHMITKKEKAPSDTIRDIKYGINKLNLIDNVNKIDIKKVNREGRRKCELYMQGKKSEEKREKQKINEIWREKNKLEEIYVINGKYEKYEEEYEEIGKVEGIHIKKNNESYIIVEINGKKISVNIQQYL